jgi:hypothetical protein
MVLTVIPSPINASAMEGKISSLPQKETHPLTAIHATHQSSTQESRRRRPARTGLPRPIVLPMHRGCPAHILAPQTQSTPRRHGRNRNPIHSSPSSAQDHHRPASHRKCRTTRDLVLPILHVSPTRILRCSLTSHSTRQPCPSLAMLEYKMEDTSLSAQIWTPHLSITQTDLVYKIENYSCGCSSGNSGLCFYVLYMFPFL